MNLKQFQKNFQSYILNDDTSIEKKILISKNLSPSQQIQIYQNGFYERIIAAMMQDFPQLCKLIGDAAFRSMVMDYLKKFPPRDFNLRYVGKNLAQFILSKDKMLVEYAELAKIEYCKV